MPFGEFRLRSSEFSFPERSDRRMHAGYFFIANGETTPLPERVRTFAFDLTTRHAYYAKVQFTMYANAQTEQEQFVEAVSDLMVELLPELMRGLPDWSEVEKTSDEG